MFLAIKNLAVAVAMVFRAIVRLLWVLIKPVLKVLFKVAVEFGSGWYAFFGGLSVYLYMTNSNWLAVVAIPLLTTIFAKMELLQKLFD